jgi:two-component system, OmpR family, response regulator
MSLKRLLLVDDEEPFTRLVKLNLEETGRYTVRIENDGAKALATAREFAPDLILLDVIMPDADGGEIAARIKADSALKTVPIIFLTAAVSQKELDGPSGMIGGRMFIAKPVNKRSLIELIDQQLS